MAADTIAICSNPDCTRHAAAPRPADLPAACPSCGAPMIDRCWKCDGPVSDPFGSYCAHCGVPLKRVLPRVTPQEPLIAICGNMECDWAIMVERTALLPTLCARCGTALVSHCWKCGARTVDLHQYYCQSCGVPLKRRRQPVPLRPETPSESAQPFPTVM
jgi:predicted RNA-binding Zn-ribbon protein involved in translation (DUF1610 family)